MTHARQRRAVGGIAVGLALVLLAGGCVYYPTVADVGGVRIQPEHGRVVRSGDGALFFVDLNSTGMFEDTLLRVETDFAKRAQLVGPNGARVEKLIVPGTSVMRLHAAGERVALSELTRELKTGESVIVTLVFEKYGPLGVVSAVE